MKKAILALAVFAAALCGCSKDIPTNGPHTGPASEYPILFGSSDTRATADLSTLQAEGFGVWAFINNATIENYALMDNVKVTHDGANWVYSPLRYWLKDTEFTFIGAYPYVEQDGYFSADQQNNGVKLTVTETPSQTDFLVATNVTDTSVEGYNTTVNLPFQHVLTSVGLKIWRDEAKHTNDQMRITKVSLSNIRKSGVYSSAAESWSYNNNKLSMEYVNNNLKDSDNIGAATMQNGSLTTGGTPAEPFGQMMLLPQTIDSSNIVALKIEYELKRNNAVDWESAELETVLPTGAWNSGQRYTYNVVLSSVTDITVYYIQTKVDQWGTPQVGGTVIIK